MLGILAYPRTGSTLIYEVLKQHYSENSSVRCIGEAFNPVEFRKLIIDRDGLSLIPVSNTSNVPQSREERFSLVYNSVHKSLRVQNNTQNDYILKVLPQDLRYEPIFDFIKNHYKRLIVTKRRDVIDTILSALIAMEHRRFNDNDNNFTYHKFEAKIVEVEWLCFLHNHFNSFVSKLLPNVIVELYYEDIIRMNRCDIIQHCGLVPNDNDDGPLPLVKLLKKEDKIPLITNINEVLRTISANIVLDNLDISSYNLT